MDYEVFPSPYLTSSIIRVYTKAMYIYGYEQVYWNIPPHIAPSIYVAADCPFGFSGQ